jgi:hypothetical protein
MEHLTPDYLDDTLTTNFTNYRIDKGGQRHYVRIYDDDLTILAPAFHTVTNKVMPKDPGLMKWFKETPIEMIQFIQENSANYGTFFHVCCGEIVVREQPFLFNPDKLDEKMDKFFEVQGWDVKECRKWMKYKKRDLRKDLLGFAIFCKEHEVKPLAIEYVAFDRFGLVATTIDLVCKMKYKKKIITAIIDLKSTDNLDSLEYPLQLLVGENLWEQEFPGIKIDRAFNYGCNVGYRMSTLHKYLNGGASGNFKPYKLKDQTKAKDPTTWSKYLYLYHSDPNNLKNVGVSLEINDDFEIDLDGDFKDALILVNEIEDLNNKELF